MGSHCFKVTGQERKNCMLPGCALGGIVAAAWLHHCVRTPEHRALLYAGRVFNDSQIIRANYTKANLLHPEWYPDDFVKWAVPYESYAAQSLYYPPYCSGGGYLLGRKSAQRIVNAYDLRSRASRPVVRVEDAFVGILAEESGMSPTDITDYIQDPPAGRAQDPALFGGRMLVHRVTEPSKAFEWLIYPVRISYGARSNSELLLRYGFTVPDNAEPDGSSNDVVPLHISCALGTLPSTAPLMPEFTGTLLLPLLMCLAGCEKEEH